MFTRLQTNIRQYPRLFKLFLALIGLTVAYYLLPVALTFEAELALTAVLAGVIYLWVTRTPERRRIIQDMLARFEGRNVCSYAEHFEPVENEEEEEGWHT